MGLALNSSGLLEHLWLLLSFFGQFQNNFDRDDI